VLPAERADAKNRSSVMGKLRSANSVRITLPTWPVAPTTPTRIVIQANGSVRAATNDFYWPHLDRAVARGFR
jgi:hypothetical protein